MYTQHAHTQLVVNKNRTSWHVLRLLMYLPVDRFMLLKPSDPVSLSHCYWLQSSFQLTRVMEHGGKVAVNVQDQYTDTPSGLVTKMWTFVVLCHFFNMPQSWKNMMECDVMVWWWTAHTSVFHHLKGQRCRDETNCSSLCWTPSSDLPTK